ncbi:hypothetical protein ACM39_12615 [Chryseobacterium sp. FH2]|uniref:nSTAND3 domain-containing NTPase n=1 Tax=Chryseobacterium sp. FH2 TaxID=1674291 RepID=UPI00065B068B|nr:restriction endonuclease [Chryseobacterium sp. FH2]KMQ67691.1 hypothetical protein ACM39_12615 [Chryseobacterium sp. FH2]
MLQYDLNIFSPKEFEEFSRDLLQAKLGVFIESFTAGKDEGIDFKFSAEKGDVIIQSKRNKNFSLLLRNLKKEVPKIEKLAPQSYIITTSVGLTPKNKKVIKDLFTPYIKSTEDIYGKDDLLNILAQNEKIEEKYYKLWIGSTRILKKVLQSKPYYSSFELKDLHSKIKLYVQNESFFISLKILREHQYIIISGIPGIGKTTLAEVLIYHYLSFDYEPVYLNGGISDEYLYLNDNKKQIFWFDDFLGKNFFDNKNGVRDVEIIIKFIKEIRKAPNKLLILTTRENVLNQAKEIHEIFKIENIEAAKSIIDISIYTRLIRAKILYNHLFHGGVHQEYLNNLIENENYEVLINHVNYNPRIIETIIKQKIWNSCPPSNFFKVTKSFFDNPQSVWLHSFENTINRFSQYTLLILFTLPSPVLIDDLETATESFFLNNLILGINYDPIQFLKSIRELENTFINVVMGLESRPNVLREQNGIEGWDTRDPNIDIEGKIFIKYQNPSIYDFLFNYLFNKEKLIGYLVNSLIFIEQFYTSFSGQKTNGKIGLNQILINKIAARLLQIEINLNSCKVNMINIDHIQHTYQNNKPFYIFLNYLYNHFSSHNKDIEGFIYRNFRTELRVGEGVYSSAYIDLLGKLDLTRFKVNEDKIFDNFLNHSFDVTDLNLSSFEKFELIFPYKYQQFIKSNRFSNVINKKVTEALRIYVGGVIFVNKVRDYKIKLEYITKKFSINLEEYLEKVNSTLDNIYSSEIHYNEDDVDIEEEIERIQEEEIKIKQEIKDEMMITDLFNSLRE